MTGYATRWTLIRALKENDKDLAVGLFRWVARNSETLKHEERKHLNRTLVTSRQTNGPHRPKTQNIQSLPPGPHSALQPTIFTPSDCLVCRNARPRTMRRSSLYRGLFTRHGICARGFEQLGTSGAFFDHIRLLSKVWRTVDGKGDGVRCEAFLKTRDQEYGWAQAEKMLEYFLEQKETGSSSGPLPVWILGEMIYRGWVDGKAAYGRMDRPGNVK